MKNKIEHTPGPWATEIAPPYILVKSEGTRIIGSTDSSDREDEANARLIAAAPELLEALDMMCGMFLQDHRDGDKWPQYKRARAAIAKAKGEK